MPDTKMSQRTQTGQKKIKKLKNLCIGKSLKLQKNKDKEKILEAREKNIISIKETG